MNADNIVVLDEDCVVGMGTHEYLLNNLFIIYRIFE